MAASIFFLALSACRQEPSGQSTSNVTPHTQMPPETITEVESKLPEYSTPIPTPQQIPTGDEIEATALVQAYCDYDYFFEPAPAPCPVDEPIISAAAEQPFEGGIMIWLEVTKSIFVFYKDERWQRFDDTWMEDQAESDPGIVASEGRYQPIRGFGKVWREQSDVRERLGWALGVELAFESKLQEQKLEDGIDRVSYLLTFNGQVFAFVNRGSDGGDWVIAAS